MKLWQKIFYNVAIIILIAIIIAISVLYIISFDKNDIPSSLNITTATFTSIMSSLSVIIAAINIRESRTQFQKNKQFEAFNHWYQKLIIDKHVDKLNKFFKKCESIVESIDYDGKRQLLKGEDFDIYIKQEVFSPFITAYRNINYNLISDASIIDTHLSQELSDQLSKFQDEFTSFFATKTINKDLIIKSVKKYYKEIIRILINFNKIT